MKFKVILIYLLLLFITLPSAIAQRPSDIPGYTPLVPRLMSLHFEENSEPETFKEITKNDIDLVKSDLLEEFISVYTHYEMDFDVAKKDESLTNPPEKLMDFDLIYSYDYRISYKNHEDLMTKLPQIKIRKSDVVEDIKIIYYTVKNGKVKNKKFKNKGILSDVNEGELKISILKDKLPLCQMVELIINIRSKDLSAINPEFNTSADFTRRLSISVPTILGYDFTINNTNAELISNNNGKFQYLKFNRHLTDWDRIIDTLESDCVTFTWKIKLINNELTRLKFNLKSLEIPLNVDIGFPRTYFYKFKE